MRRHLQNIDHDTIMRDLGEFLPPRSTTCRAQIRHLFLGLALLPSHRRGRSCLDTRGNQVLQALELVDRLGVSEKPIWQRESKYLGLGDGQASRSLNRCGYKSLASKDGAALGRPHVRHDLIHGAGWLKQQADTIETVNRPAEREEVNLAQYQYRWALGRQKRIRTVLRL